MMRLGRSWRKGWEKAVQRAFEQRNDSAAHDVLMWLGSKQPPHAHEQVWRVFEGQPTDEKGLVGFKWFYDPRGLPKLEAIVLKAEGRARHWAMEFNGIN